MAVNKVDGRECGMVRQGDVLLIRSNSGLKAASPVARENGRVILAHGEVTVHAHAISANSATLVADGPQRQMLVDEKAGWHEAWQIRNTITGHIGYIPKRMKPEQYTGVESLGATLIQGVEVEHEEHYPFIVPNGDWDVVIQSEYTPAAIRNVAD